MPYTTLVAGTTITASWANSNVRDQTIAPFASASARDSAITSPVEGQYAHLNDTNKLTHYNGTAWVPATSNIVAYQTLTGNSSIWSSTTTTDFSLSAVPVNSARLYRVCINTQALLSVAADGSWALDFAVGGTNTLRLGYVQVSQNFHQWQGAQALWEPATGTPNLTIVATEIQGTASLQLEATSTTPRHFWVEDIGPR